MVLLQQSVFEVKLYEMGWIADEVYNKQANSLVIKTANYV